MTDVSELQGRMIVLEKQRNDAMNQAAILGGQLESALAKIQELEAAADANTSPEDE